MKDFGIKRVEGPLRVFRKPIIEMLQKGEIFIDMSTSFNPTCYNDEAMQLTFTDCAKNVAKIRILLDKEVNIGELREEVPYIFDLKKKYPNTIEIARATGDVPHCIIVDGKFFRIEGEHQTNEAGEFITRNLIIENPPPVITKLIYPTFDLWWDNADKF